MPPKSGAVFSVWHYYLTFAKEEKLKKYKRPFYIFIISVMLSVMAYSVLIWNELTNTYDGMWQGTRYTGYKWVVSIGRWFWPMVGIMRNHLSPEPFTSMLSIILFSTGACLTTYLFGVKSNGRAVLVILNMLINTAVCASLSYRYMSPTFAAAFLFSIIAVWLLRQRNQHTRLMYCMSVVFLVASLACYQMDLGCFCVIALLLTVLDLIEKEDLKEPGVFILKAGAVAAISCCLYKIVWDFALRLFKIDAAAYKGANQLSIGRIISHFPEQLTEAYRSFFTYYFGNDLKHHAFQKYPFYACILILFFIGILAVTWAKTSSFSKVRICFVAGAVLLIPAAANAAVLIAVDGGSNMIQMTIPLTMVFPCLLSLMDATITGMDTYKRGLSESPLQFANWMNLVCTALMIFILYGSFLMVSIDQHVMLVSRQTTLAFMNRVISGTEMSMSQSLKPEIEYVFIGRPSDNPMYRRDEVWNYANSYARYGQFWLSGDCCTQSYAGLLRDCGLNVSLNRNHHLWHKLE